MTFSLTFALSGVLPGFCPDSADEPQVAQPQPVPPEELEQRGKERHVVTSLFLGNSLSGRNPQVDFPSVTPRDFSPSPRALWPRETSPGERVECNGHDK